jgi:hypothetical protein
MNIAILGTGKMGTVVGKRLVAADHTIVFGSRDPKSTRHKYADFPNISVRSYSEAAKDSELSIIAVPWAFTLALVDSIATELDGKIVVDLTNPLAADISHLVVGGTNSAAEQIARILVNSKIVKAFNGITADNFLTPNFSGDVAQIFYCGDDAESKKVVRRVIESCGYEAQDCGALTNARYLEGIAMLWLQLAFWEDRGSDFSFRIARRQ